MSIFLNYKDVEVQYNSTGIFCNRVGIEVSNSLAVARDRRTISNGRVYGSQRPITNISLDYLINSDGDLFYKSFQDVFKGQASYIGLNNSLSVGSLNLNNVYPQNISISSDRNSLFGASVNLTYYGNIIDQIQESAGSNVYEDYISLGHLANTPISGAEYISSVSCNFSLQLKPLFYMGNTGYIPDFVDINNRQNSCSVRVNNFQKIVSTSGDQTTISFDVKDFGGNVLQNYEVAGEVSQNDIRLNSESVMEGNISIVDFV